MALIGDARAIAAFARSVLSYPARPREELRIATTTELGIIVVRRSDWQRVGQLVS
jgi:hypothetical protein